MFACVSLPFYPNYTNFVEKSAHKAKKYAHKARDGQYLLLRTNRKRTVRGAHKTRDSCTYNSIDAAPNRGFSYVEIKVVMVASCFLIDYSNPSFCAHLEQCAFD